MGYSDNYRGLHGSALEQCWPPGLFLQQPCARQNPASPRGSGQRKACGCRRRETEEGPVSRPAAPGSLFLVCSPPDSETIGVPHPQPGEEGGVGERGFCCAACLFSSEHGPGGPTAGARPARPLSSPRPALPQCLWATRRGPASVMGLGSGRAGAGILGPSCLQTHSGNHLPSSPCLTTYCAPARGTEPWTRQVPVPRSLCSSCGGDR